MSKITKNNEGLLGKTNKPSKTINMNKLVNRKSNETVEIKEKSISIKGKVKKNKINKEARSDDFIIIRKELIGHAPLTYLDLWNKFKVALSYRDMKSGKTDAKLEEKRRIKESTLMGLQSQILNKLKEETRDIMDGDTKGREVEIYSNNPLFREALTKVLKSEYFKIFEEVKELKPNSNYLKYVKKMPVIIHFVKESKDGGLLNG